METITLSYDNNNTTIKKLVDSLIAAGIFIKKETSCNKKTLQAIEEIKNGGGLRCNSFEEYLKAVQ